MINLKTVSANYHNLKRTPAFSYTLFKYIEFAVNALLFFMLAKRSSPYEYGEASGAFLIISYSSFIVLGINQVVVKWYSINNDILIKDFLLKYSMIYNLLFSLIVFGIVYKLDISKYYLYSAIIATSKINIEGFVTSYRVQGKFYKINIIYITSSLTFLVLFFLYVKSVEDFFFCWMISSILSLIIGFLFSLDNMRKKVNYKFMKVFADHNRQMFADGLKFTLISIISTLMATSDRFYLIYIIKLDKNLLGNIQLADNISNVISLSFSTVLFVLTPSLIKKISDKELSPKQFYNKSTSIFVLIILLLILIFFPIQYLVSRFFEQYNHITFPLIVYLLIKSFSLFLSIPYIISIAFNEENKYLRIQGLWALILFSIMVLLYVFLKTNSDMFYIVPIVVLSVNIILFFHFRMKFKSERIK